MSRLYQLEKDVYGLYFQKSSKFLYPLIGISDRAYTKPNQTYIAWEGVYNPDEYKLVVEYIFEDPLAFKKFEAAVLLRNKYFEDVFEVSDKSCVYVFDLTEFSKDWKYFLKGKYSKYSAESKHIIKKHMTSPHNRLYIDSYLEPQNYYEHYAKLLNTEPDTLREVGELCDPFNLKRETLTIDILEIKNIIQ